jgi:FtsH-binding integral membrane protein
MDNEAMNPSYSVGGGYGTAAADRTRTLFGQVMWLVAASLGFFALGGYAGRNLSEGWTFVAFIAAFVCLFAMRFTAQRSAGGSIALLMAVGFLLGLAMAPLLSYYASTNPQVLWQAGGATALFIAGFGAAGYATRRDLAVVGRVAFWALLALILFGIVLIFVHIPGGELIYSILGLVIFAALTMFDFQRLRRSKNMDAAPLIAASIFLDAVNVFLFFLRIFGNRD